MYKQIGFTTILENKNGEKVSVHMDTVESIENLDSETQNSQNKWFLEHRVWNNSKNTNSWNTSIPKQNPTKNNQYN